MHDYWSFRQCLMQHNALNWPLKTAFVRRHRAELVNTKRLESLAEILKQMFGELSLRFAATICLYKYLVKAWYLVPLFFSVHQSYIWALNLSFCLLEQQSPSYMQCKVPWLELFADCWTLPWGVHTHHCGSAIQRMEHNPEKSALPPSLTGAKVPCKISHLWFCKKPLF